MENNNQQQEPQQLDLDNLSVDQLKDIIIDIQLQKNLIERNLQIALTVLLKKLQPPQPLQQPINLPKLKKINLPPLQNNSGNNTTANYTVNT